MFKPRKRKLRVALKGLFARPIQYEVRVPEANWQNYLGQYENQKWGQYDTDDCWCLSVIRNIEIQLNWLWENNMFSPEAKDFFTKNGYRNQVFCLSERYLEILSGNLDNGGTAEEAWQLTQKYGCIPRSMLTYSNTAAWQASDKQAFDADYFNVIDVTQTMKDLGQRFLKYVNVAYQVVGTHYHTPARVILEAALKQAPLNIGIPIPANVFNWNNTFVQYDGGRIPAHEIVLYGIEAQGDYLSEDQYQPDHKTLSPDYFLAFVTQGIVTPVQPAVVNPIPQPQGEMNNDFWSCVFQWFNGIFSKVPVGFA